MNEPHGLQVGTLTDGLPVGIQTGEAWPVNTLTSQNHYAPVRHVETGQKGIYFFYCRLIQKLFCRAVTHFMIFMAFWAHAFCVQTGWTPVNICCEARLSLAFWSFCCTDGAVQLHGLDFVVELHQWRDGRAGHTHSFARITVV